jgi:hypothetical protein
VTIPVFGLDEFFATYTALLEAGDAVGLGALYTQAAVVSVSGAPSGDSWAVGRAEIVAQFQATFAAATIDRESKPTHRYERRGDDLAARFGRFRSTVTDKSSGAKLHLVVDSVEILGLSPNEGWQYLADQTHIVSITRTPEASAEPG